MSFINFSHFTFAQQLYIHLLSRQRYHYWHRVYKRLNKMRLERLISSTAHSFPRWDSVREAHIMYKITGCHATQSFQPRGITSRHGRPTHGHPAWGLQSSLQPVFIELRMRMQFPRCDRVLLLILLLIPTCIDLFVLLLFFFPSNWTLSSSSAATRRRQRTI